MLEEQDHHISQESIHFDICFNINVFVAQYKSIDLKVRKTDHVQDIHNSILDKEETCHKTCFSLQLNGRTLQKFFQLQDICDLKDGTCLYLIDEPYSMKDIRFHICHVKSLLNLFENSYSFNGHRFESPTIFKTICKINKKENNCNILPPKNVIPSSIYYELSALFPQNIDFTFKPALNLLTLSGYNPPQGNRKLHGDLIYLKFISLENNCFHITGAKNGFFINKSSDDEFNANKKNTKEIFTTLIELLKFISFKFKTLFEMHLKNLFKTGQFDRLETSLKVFPWISHQIDVKLDFFMFEDILYTKQKNEASLMGCCRNWNERLQCSKELNKNTMAQRVMRDRVIINNYTEFVEACANNAVEIIDNYLKPVKFGTGSLTQIFIRNNIFFTLSYETWTAQNNELKCVNLYNELGIEGLFNVGTVIIDYKGYRLLAQSVIPGVLERDPNESIDYGPISVNSYRKNSQFSSLLKKACTFLNIQPHTIINKSGEKIELFSSYDCKGIIGTDNRYYILDVFNTLPPDINFLNLENENKFQMRNENAIQNENKKNFFCLRKELIDYFVKYKNTSTKSKKNKSLQSSEIINNISFNPNIFMTNLEHSSEKELQIQKELIIEAGEFIHTNQFLVFINDCVNNICTPLDGVMLVDELHKRGINVRYLGKITKLLNESEIKYAYRIAVTELICRSAKHVFNAYLQNIETTNIANAVSHFLNSLFSSSIKSHTNDKKRNGKNKNKNSIDTENWKCLSTSLSWNLVKNNVENYFSFTLNFDSLEKCLTHIKLHKISFLRSICLKTGIQILLREYNFDDKSNESFTENDILNIFPIVKHINPCSKEAKFLFSKAEEKIKNGNLNEAYSVMMECLSLKFYVQGTLHKELSICLRYLARLSFMLKFHSKAISFQKKTLIMSEKVNGIDHPYTIFDYNNLAIYYIAQKKISLALKCLYRSRYLLTIISGHYHPELVKIDINIGLILNYASEYEIATQFLKAALENHLSHYGKDCLQVAMIYHFLSENFEDLGMYREAIIQERERYLIFGKIYKQEPEKIKICELNLKVLIDKTVKFEKMVKELKKGNSKLEIPLIEKDCLSLEKLLNNVQLFNSF